jgi:hypothetical protein
MAMGEFFLKSGNKWTLRDPAALDGLAYGQPFLLAH